MQIVLNRDKPCLTEYISVLFVHTRAIFQSYSYQLIPRHGWSPILVPVNPCITEYTVWQPCARPCFVEDRLYLYKCFHVYLNTIINMFVLYKCVVRKHFYIISTYCVFRLCSCSLIFFLRFFNWFTLFVTFKIMQPIM